MQIQEKFAKVIVKDMYVCICKKQKQPTIKKKLK